MLFFVSFPFSVFVTHLCEKNIFDAVLFQSHLYNYIYSVSEKNRVILVTISRYWRYNLSNQLISTTENFSFFLPGFSCDQIFSSRSFLVLKKIEKPKLNIKNGNTNSRIQKYFTECAERKVSDCCFIIFFLFILFYIDSLHHIVF